MTFTCIQQPPIYGRFKWVLILMADDVFTNTRRISSSFAKNFFILLFSILITSILFQNQLSEAQKNSIYQFFENGKSLYEQGNYEEAIKWFDKALAIDPNQVDALNNKGFALDSLGQHDEAIKWFHKALAIDPNDYGALNGKDAALAQLGK